MKFELTVLGTSAAVPYKNRFLSGQVLNIQEEFFLIDCGEATQYRFQQLGIKPSKINHILISPLRPSVRLCKKGKKRLGCMIKKPYLDTN